MKKLGWCLLMISALGGCSSTPPISYYTLDMTPSGRASVPGDLHIEGVRTAESLSRSQIQILASPTRIDYYATHEWAGSLGEMVQRKLEIELTSNGDGSFQLTLAGTLLECSQVDLASGAEARMSLAVTLRDSAAQRFEAPLIQKTYTSTKGLSMKSPNGVAQALSRCAEEIAAEIAGDIRGLTG